MKVLVDTSVWSQVLRYKSPDGPLAAKMEELISDNRVVMIGPIRQELLSGISDIKQFQRLKETLAYFDDISLLQEHFVKAAEFCNICRREGVQGSGTDFLICAVANLEKLYILTTDRDFSNFKKHLKIEVI
jgi:predicted nucleic acid-binding protein